MRTFSGKRLKTVSKRRPYFNCRNQGHTPDATRETSIPQGGDLSPQGPYEKYKAKEAERERRRAEEHTPMQWWWFKQRDPIARSTLYVGFFTLALVIVSFLQFCTLQNQLKLTQVEQRPWIVVSHAEIVSVKGDQKKVRMTLHDVGHSPAYVWIYVKDIKPKEAWQLRSQEACLLAMSEKDSMNNKLTKYFVFPGRDFMYDTYPGVEQAQMAGCILYETDEGGPIHRTPFAAFIKPKSGVMSIDDSDILFADAD